MGFGWLFTGYFFACALAPLFSPLAVLMPFGYGFITFSLWRLRAYHPRFRLCFFFSFLMLPVSLYYGLYGLTQLGVPLSEALFGVVAFKVFYWIYFALWCLFQCFLLYATGALCREIGYEPLVGLSARNLVFLLIFAAAYLVSQLPFFPETVSKLFTVPLLLLQMMCVALNLWFFFKCYRLIVPEGAEALPEEVQDEAK